jgi:hypothetical protein
MGSCFSPITAGPSDTRVSETPSEAAAEEDDVDDEEVSRLTTMSIPEAVPTMV